MLDMRDAFPHYLYGLGEFEGLGCKNVTENYKLGHTDRALLTSSSVLREPAETLIDYRQR